MANDFNELKKRLEYYVDDQVSDDVALMLFNQCNEDLSEASGYSKTATTEYDKDLPTISLPLDFIEMLELKIKRESDEDYYRVRPIGLVQPEDFTELKVSLGGKATGYEHFGGSIELRPQPKVSGMLLVRYYAMLPVIHSLSDPPPIKGYFHDAYALYAAAKFFQNYMDELPAKNDYFQEYLAKKAELNEQTQKARTRARSNTVYQFRSWT